MSIKTLDYRLRLPRMGRIRLGVKERNAQGKEYPKEVPFFVVPDELRATLGDRPTRIPVLFPTSDIARLLTCDFTVYGRGRGSEGPGLLIRRCDGERFTERPREGGEISGRCPKQPYEPCPHGCQAKGALNVIVLDGPAGVYQVVLGGEQRIADLLMELEVFHGMFGRLTDIVFELERVETVVQVRKEDGSRLPKTGWPVHIRVSTTAKQALKLRGRDVAALPGATEEAEHEAVAEPDDDAPAPPESARTGQIALPGSDDAPWDISMAFKSAGEIGVSAALYTRYLAATYGTDVDNLPVAALAEQEKAFRGLADTPGAVLALKARIISAANAAMKRNGR